MTTTVFAHIEAWFLAKDWRTWIGHGLLGVVLAAAVLLLTRGDHGAAVAFVAGAYGWREFDEVRHETDWTGKKALDHVMDVVSPVGSALLVAWMA